MRVKTEFRDDDTMKTLFRWTTPEVDSYEAAREAAKSRAKASGYTVRAASIRVVSAKENDVVVYLKKKV